MTADKVRKPDSDIGWRPELLWRGESLYLVATGKLRRVAGNDLMPHLLSHGLTFADDSHVDYTDLPQGEAIISPGQIAWLIARSLDRGAPAKTAMRISWIAPDLILGGGGYRNIVRCALQLERLGHDVSIHLVRTAETNESIKQLIHEHFYPFDGFAGRYDPATMGGDIVLATHWSTMKDALAVAHRYGEVVYFVQDFEPAFYPMGSEYLLAEQTYRQISYAITSGAWCESFLEREFGVEADHFQFPIDKSIYYAKGRVKRDLRVVFFAKPEMPRRCYEIGVEGLKQLHRIRPDVEIVMFGSEFAKTLDVGFPVTQLGVLPGITDLADLYRGAQVGLAFSTTNPSLVPYEMMACGLPVVDLAREGQEVNYGGRRDIALLVDLDPLKMASSISALLDDELERRHRSSAGIEFSATFPDEEGVGRLIENYLAQRIETFSPEQRRRADPVALLRQNAA